MSIVRSLTADRMLAIEAASIVDGDVVGDNLILRRHDGKTINAGSVRGPQGDPGPPEFHIHSEYLTRDGSTGMDGNLILNDGADLLATSTGDGIDQGPMMILSRDARPIIELIKSAGVVDKKKWRIYVSGGATETGATASSLSFLARTDAEGDLGVIRMYRDGRMLLGADPLDPLDVATKRYVVGTGGTMDANATVPSNASGQTRLKYKEAFKTWGGVTRSGDSLVVPIAGLYRISFNGGFGTNGTGIIRLVSVGSDTTPNPAFATGVLVGSHVDPTQGSSGYGAIMSGTGVVTLSAGQKLSLWARQDSGVNLVIEANLFVELIRSS